MIIPLFPWLQWNLNWKVFKGELVWSKLWTSRKWKDIFIGFVLGLFSLLPGSSDLITDYLSAHTFIKGTDYIKDVKNLNDSSVKSPNCTQIGISINSYYDITGKESNSSTMHYRSIVMMVMES